MFPLSKKKRNKENYNFTLGKKSDKDLYILICNAVFLLSASLLISRQEMNLSSFSGLPLQENDAEQGKAGAGRL